MKHGKLIIISGPSGVGKGTIIAALLKENLNYLYLSRQQHDPNVPMK
jgi:guanylate kinase